MDRKAGLLGVDLYGNFWLKEAETRDFVHGKDLDPSLHHLVQCATQQHGQMVSRRASSIAALCF